MSEPTFRVSVLVRSNKARDLGTKNNRLGPQILSYLWRQLIDHIRKPLGHMVSFCRGPSVGKIGESYLSIIGPLRMMQGTRFPGANESFWLTKIIPALPGAFRTSFRFSKSVGKIRLSDLRI